eukprot:TRINITY_DN82092_c0_g1_i1.p1 TRINITY_DN82092_c0_g1~~TRINITY_DN82092_c0_g1_i1.p1  ORF type:complete len:408 (-),score=64.95 TRINITY_DN82092_c0_g1_i1:561-1784(-)
MADAIVNKLFVSRLPCDVTRNDVHFVFAKYGVVTDVRVCASGTHSYAFIKYSTWTESERAIQELHGSRIFGTDPLVVRFADVQKTEPQDVVIAERKLFVGSLPQGATTADLMPVFSPFGDIEEMYVLRRPDGQSQGCAFVKFKSWAAAEKAIAGLQGTPFPGHTVPMVVHFAKARKQQNLNQDRLLLEGAKAAFSALPVWPEVEWQDDQDAKFEDRKLFIGQLRLNVNEGDLLPILMPFGSIKQLYVLRDRATGRSKGCAFVVYATAEQADAAVMALDGKVLGPNARPLTVCFASRKLSLTGATVEAPAQVEEVEEQTDFKLFVGQVPRTAREADLLPLFQPFGLVTRLYCLKDKRFGSNQGCAFVVYKTKSAAERAMVFHNGRTFLRHDRPLIVRFATPSMETLSE